MREDAWFKQHWRLPWSNVWKDYFADPFFWPPTNASISVSSYDANKAMKEEMRRALLGLALILDAEIVLDGGGVGGEGVNLRVRRAVSTHEQEAVSMRNVVPMDSG